MPVFCKIFVLYFLCSISPFLDSNFSHNQNNGRVTLLEIALVGLQTDLKSFSFKTATALSASELTLSWFLVLSADLGWAVFM